LAKQETKLKYKKMNEIYEAIKSRRIVKPENFLSSTIEEDKINTILECATWAPTHGKTEPWAFWVYSGDGREKLGILHADIYKEFTPKESFSEDTFQKIKSRPLQGSHAIVLVMKRGSNSKIPKIEELLSCGCAAQNMLLQAHSLDLGAYWSTGGYMYSELMKSAYGLGPDDEFLGCIYLGNIPELNLIGKRNNGWEEKTVIVK
jgi:nitroreductase